MRNRIKPLLIRDLSIVMFVGLTGVPCVLAQTYSVNNIPTLDPLGQGQIYPMGISSTGVITGYYESTAKGGYTAQTFIAQVAAGSVATQNVGYTLGDLPTTSGNYVNGQSWGFSVNAG